MPGKNNMKRENGNACQLSAFLPRFTIFSSLLELMLTSNLNITLKKGYRKKENKQIQSRLQTSNINHLPVQWKMWLTYLGKLHTRWITNHCPIRLCIPSILDQLRVPYSEVLIWLFPLWEDSNDRSQVPAVSGEFQVFLEDFEHFSRGRHVTSVEYLVKKSFVSVSDGSSFWITGWSQYE